MKTIFTLLLVIGCFTITHGQVKTRFPAWTFNTQHTRVYGLSVGYMATKKTVDVFSNGVRFELLGLGILLPLIPSSPLAQSDSAHKKIMNEPYAETINGINLSPLGTGCNCRVNGINIYGVGSITRRTNGISLGGMMNFAEVQNGLQAGIFFNETYHSRGIQAAFIANTNTGTTTGLMIAAMNETTSLKGIQIGVFNKTKKIKGLQIGIWNVNEKRKWPLVNF